MLLVKRMASISRKLGWVMIFAVLMLFLFPLHWGSFTQTHGPTTALRALMAAQNLLAAIALWASVALCMITLHWVSETGTPVLVDRFSNSSFQLRC